jgi:dihydrofolate synthase / folylpolyglutamate synthase
VVVKASTAAAGVKKPGDFTSYEDALEYLYSRVDVERLSPSRVDPEVWKLDRMRSLLKQLGDPQLTLRCVHVAGTKGKGSTCEMTAAALEGCGYAVGIYTSPHIVDIRERVRINRRMIEKDTFLDVATRVARAGELIASTAGECTFFELMTAIGLLHFSEQAVDVAVIEVGLGGRLDSTNVITPEVAAVSSISMDHWQILGDTLEKIAREKAGIFKPGIPSLTVEQKPGVIDAMRDVATQNGTTLSVIGQDIDFSMRFEASGGGASGGPQTKVCLTTPRVNYEHVIVPMKGEHQAHNCGLALAILDRLVERGFSCPEAGVVRGLSTVNLPGRMELAATSPRIILDGAHNRDSVRALIKAIGQHIRADSIVFIFGCASDKDIDGMLAELALGADKVVFTRTASARSADPRDLARRLSDQHHKMAQVAETFDEALSIARRAVGREDLICVTGSFYLVGDARKHLDALRAARTNGAATTRPRG